MRESLQEYRRVLPTYSKDLLDRTINLSRRIILSRFPIHLVGEENFEAVRMHHEINRGSTEFVFSHPSILDPLYVTEIINQYVNLVGPFLMPYGTKFEPNIYDKYVSKAKDILKEVAAHKKKAYKFFNTVFQRGARQFGITMVTIAQPEYVSHPNKAFRKINAEITDDALLRLSQTLEEENAVVLTAYGGGRDHGVFRKAQMAIARPFKRMDRIPQSSEDPEVKDANSRTWNYKLVRESAIIVPISIRGTNQIHDGNAKRMKWKIWNFLRKNPVEITIGEPLTYAELEKEMEYFKGVHALPDLDLQTIITLHLASLHPPEEWGVYAEEPYKTIIEEIQAEKSSTTKFFKPEQQEVKYG